MKINIETAKKIIKRNFVMKIDKIERFTTGLCHYVYDVKLENGKEIVLRISGSDSELAGGIFWNSELRKIGIPVPKILVYDNSGEIHYSIHEKILGNDLGNVFKELSINEKKELAQELAAIQNTVSENIKADLYGYALNFQDPNMKENWVDVIKGSINWLSFHIKENGIFSTIYAERIKEKFDKYKDYLNNVPAQAFLDDITTKNVLIHQKKLSGIVDTDTICFGDKLKHLGLTKMALISLKEKTDYIDFFEEAYGLDPFQKEIVNFYTLLFCGNFMAEIGQKFNKEEVKIDNKQVELYKETFDELIEIV